MKVGGVPDPPPYLPPTTPTPRPCHRSLGERGERFCLVFCSEPGLCLTITGSTSKFLTKKQFFCYLPPPARLLWEGLGVGVVGGCPRPSPPPRGRARKHPPPGPPSHRSKIQVFWTKIVEKFFLRRFAPKVSKYPFLTPSTP